MQSLNILVVDDSALTVQKITHMLSEMGHQVVACAASGVEALSVYRNFNPQLVTMDITMPDMDGVQAARLIMEEDPQANIIMITSHGQEKMVLAAIEAGAKGYILKPIKADKLQSVIEQIYTTESTQS